MSSRDSDAPLPSPEPPSACEGIAAGAAGAAGAEQVATLGRPPPPRVTAEALAGALRLENITQDTADRLIAAAERELTRASRGEQETHVMLRTFGARRRRAPLP